jgi:hypothetical protein
MSLWKILNYPHNQGFNFFNQRAKWWFNFFYEKTTLVLSQAFRAWKIHCTSLQWAMSWSTVHLHRVARPKQHGPDVVVRPTYLGPCIVARPKRLGPTLLPDPSVGLTFFLAWPGVGQLKKNLGFNILYEKN